MLRYKSKYKKVGVLPIYKAKSNVSSVGPSSERNTFVSEKGPTLETLDFLYFDWNINNGLPIDAVATLLV